jgi:hypothetical protein
MAILADIVMLGWIPVVLVMFATMPPRRALIAAFLVSWLFLPISSYKLPLLPDYTKISATCMGAVLGACIFDTKRVLRFRVRWIDVPMAVFCLCPLISSLTNGLGVWDGASGVMTQVTMWGLPYFLGRVYLSDLRSLKELAVGMFISGLVYVPFCLFEVRMSPQLEAIVYGGRMRSGIRLGGWRPAVFMQSGLELVMWMSVCSLIGIWLWRTGALKKVLGFSMSLLVPVLLVTTLLCRGFGALALLIMGLCSMWFSKATKTRFALVCLIAVAPAYIALRASGIWHGEGVVPLVSMIDEGRAGSFAFRLDNENILTQKALQRPIFGWGQWGRSRVYDEWGRDISTTDGLWIIELGAHGFVGLISVFLALLLPLSLTVYRCHVRRLVSSDGAALLALAVITSLFAIDCLPNGQFNPIFVLAGGGVASVVLTGHTLGSRVANQLAGNPAAPRISDRVPRRRLRSGCE